ncbi:MAG TPA: serine hydrolase domain-containing protein [Candidatus Limnocylindrales bacterium]|nr:serine hydrolase domain-containing protein [Candidatus Limnocylindrales bacterium]
MSNPSSDWRTIDQTIKAAADSGAVPGAVAIIIGRDGVLHEAAAGTPHGTGTMFRIASMTKAVTSVAALQLVEQGRLSLDAAVASIVPEFGELQVLEGFDGNRPRLRPPARQATIRQLMTHTAGHGYWFSNADLLRYHDLTDTPTVITGRKISIRTPLVSDPGTRWEYGVNTDWLGLVVECVSGKTLDRYFASHIFEPLGMKEASFTPTQEQRSRMMPVHQRVGAQLELNGFEFEGRPEFWAGGHGVYATAGDFGRFLRALLRGGELDGARILQQDTSDLMFSDQLSGIALPEQMKSAVPELTNDVATPPVRQTWGLGLHVVLEDLPGMRRAGTGDWAGLFNSYYWIDRTSGMAGAFFTQILPFFDLGAVQTAMSVEAAAYAQLGIV